MPPPMALHVMCLNENVIDVAVGIAKSGERKVPIAALHRAGVTMYELDMAAKPRKPPCLKWSAKVLNSELPNIVHRQVSFGLEQIVSVLSSNTSASAVFNLDIKTGLLHEDVFLLREEIRGLVHPGVYSKSFLVQTKQHVIAGFPLSGTFSIKSQLRYPLLEIQTPRVEIVSFRHEAKKSSLGGDELHNCIQSAAFFGLSSQGCLFANKRLLANNCTSFLVTPAHLIFTTSNHLLKFVHMAEVEGRYLL